MTRKPGLWSGIREHAVRREALDALSTRQVPKHILYNLKKTVYRDLADTKAPVLRCLIADDEPLALGLLEKYIHQTPFLHLSAKAQSALEALEQFGKTQAELLWLDIQMPGLSGLSLPALLPPGPKVIFTTAFESYALEGFRANALDYLLKPFSYEDFLRAAQRAQHWFAHSPPQAALSPPAIFVHVEYKLVRIELKEVLYIEGLKDYVKIHLATQSRPVLTRMSLKELEEKLPAYQFMRIHRSYIVSLEQIKVIERSQVVFEGVRIPVADPYKEAFQRFIDSRLLR